MNFFCVGAAVSLPSALAVNNSVPFQMVHENKSFPTLRTAVGPLTTVCPLVDPQAALLREPLAALTAAVRLLTGVCPVVNAEMGGALEGLSTHRAPEGSLSLVVMLVHFKLVQEAVRLSTQGADIPPCCARLSFLLCGGLVAA